MLRSIINLFLQPDELAETKLLKLQLKNGIILNKSGSTKDITASCIFWKAYMQGIMNLVLSCASVEQRKLILLDLKQYRFHYGPDTFDIQVFQQGKSDLYHQLQKNKKQNQKQTN